MKPSTAARATINTSLSTYTHAQLNVLADLASKVAAVNVTATTNPASPWATQTDVVSRMSHVLHTHHATTGTALEKTAFETAFVSAVPGTRQNDKRTSAYADITTATGAHIALKTQSDQLVRHDRVDITKLSEARWLQQIQAHDPAEYARLMRRHYRDYIATYCAAVDRILVMQSRPVTHGYTYDLVEVPTRLLRLSAALPVTVFPTERGGRLHLRERTGNAYATIKLDYSDGKVGLLSVTKSICVVHATWHVTTG